MPANRTCEKCGGTWPSRHPLDPCPRCLFLAALRSLADPQAATEVIGGAAADAAQEPRETQRLGGYEVLEQLGRGAQGVVYRARQVSLNRIVALKVLLHADTASPHVLRRWRIEAESMAQIHHPNIVAVHDFGSVDGESYLVMDLIRGRSLAKWIKEGKFALPTGRERHHRAAARETQTRIARLMVTVARAVHAAHEHGFLHRDLKPGNILMDEQGQPHVVDFGLAKALEGEDTDSIPGAVMGTVPYMSSEQAEGKKVGVSTDIYSLGVILYELLTGRPPFQGETPTQTLRLVLEAEPRHPRARSPWVDNDLATICLHCLNKNAGERYLTAAALAEDLENWLQGRPLTIHPDGPVLRLRRWVRRNQMATALILSLFAGVAVAGYGFRSTFLKYQDYLFARAILVDNLNARLDLMFNPPPYFEVDSRTRAVRRRETPSRAAAARLYTVGVIVGRTGQQTLQEFDPLLTELERTMSRLEQRVVRIHLRLYPSEETLLQDLVDGNLDIARANPRVYVEARDLNPKVQPLVRPIQDQEPYAIFANPRAGITNVAGLKDHPLLIFDRTSAAGEAARAVLMANGLSAREVNCTFLRQSCLATNPAKWFREFSDEAGVQAKRSVIDLVLPKIPRSQDGPAPAYVAAGVGLVRRLYSLTNNPGCIFLATFQAPKNHWFASAKVSAAEAQAFQSAILDPQTMRSWWDLLPEAEPGETPGFQRVTDADYDALRRSREQAACFDDPSH